MKLNQYLDDNGLTQAAFAEAIGVKQVTVNRYITGARFPSKETIERIAKQTGGAVSPADWFSEEPEGAA